MAGVSVVQYNSSAQHKVLQQNNMTNNNNNNINNNGADRRDIVILRKNSQMKDLDDSDILYSNKKKSRNGKEIRTQPPPIAVARRNARERNRVKQVNNGFANLRQHIPNFIASNFESNSRGGSKKLSKVETLRMAVEYIKSLEELLALDNNSETNNISNSTSSSFSSPLSSNPHYHQILSPTSEDDDLSSNPTPSPQYMRIDTAMNSYQIISNNLYDNSENLEPLNILSETDLDFAQRQDLLNDVHGSDSLSPGMYSEPSLSPMLIEKQLLVTVVKNKLEDVEREPQGEVPVISLKNEQELPQQYKSNVLNVMQWWEQQQLHHDGTS